MDHKNPTEKKQVLRFAIIIAVTHSIKCLENSLKSLANLNYEKECFKVVLIDCHVLPGLNEFFHKQLGLYECQITTIRLPEQSTEYPAWLHESRLNEARNTAMQKVPAQNFVFTEDDCMFEPDWPDRGFADRPA